MPKLYQTPKGQWAGTEKDWLAKMREEGSDPKETKRRHVDVPTKKPELLEFLTFHNINVLFPNQPRSETVTTVTEGQSLDEVFDAAPISHQLELAVRACDNADAALKKHQA